MNGKDKFWNELKQSHKDNNSEALDESLYYIYKTLVDHITGISGKHEDINDYLYVKTSFQTLLQYKKGLHFTYITPGEHDDINLSILELLRSFTPQANKMQSMKALGNQDLIYSILVTGDSIPVKDHLIRRAQMTTDFKFALLKQHAPLHALDNDKLPHAAGASILENNRVQLINSFFARVHNIDDDNRNYDKVISYLNSFAQYLNNQNGEQILMNLIRYVESEYYSANNPLQRFSLTLGELVEESELYRILRNAQFVLDMDEFQIHEPLRLESLKFIMALIKNACDKTTPHARISVLFDQGPYHYSAIGGYLFDALEELFQIGDGGFSSDNYRHFIEFYDRHKNNPRIIKQLENYVAFANDLRSYPGVSDSAEEAYDSLTLGFISAVRSDLPAYLYRYSNQLSLDKFCWVIREQLNQGNLSEKMILDIVTLIKYSGLELSKDYIVNANFILSYFRGNNRLARFVAGINRSVAHAPHKYFIDVSPHNQPTYLSLELKKILRDPRNMRLDFYRAYSAIGLNVLLRQKRMIGENYNLPSEIVGRLVNKNIYHSRNIRYINAILPLNTTLPYGDNEYRGEYFKLIYSILQDHQLTDESQFIRTLLASNTYIVTTGVRITRINDEDLKQIKKLIKGKKILVDNRMTRAYLDKTLGPWRVRLLAGDTINRYHHICKSSKINPYSIEATATGELVVLLNSFSAINTLENSEALKSVTRLALMYKLRNKFNLDHEALIHLTKIIGENKRGAQLDRLWNKLFYPKRKNNFFANSFMRYFISSKGRIRNNRDDIAGLYTLVHPSFSPFSAIDDFVEEIFRHIDVKRSDSVKAIVNFAKELNLLGIKHIRYLSQLVAVTNAIDNHSDLATTIGWLQNNFVIDSTLISAPSEYGTLSFMKRSILHAVESNLDHRDYLTRHYAVDANMTDRLNAERSSGEANIIKDTDSSIRNTLKKYLTKYSPSKYLIGNNSGSSQTTNRAIDNSINRRSRV